MNRTASVKLYVELTTPTRLDPFAQRREDTVKVMFVSSAFGFSSGDAFEVGFEVGFAFDDDEEEDGDGAVTTAADGDKGDVGTDDGEGTREIAHEGAVAVVCFLATVSPTGKHCGCLVNPNRRRRFGPAPAGVSTTERTSVEEKAEGNIGLRAAEY